MTTPKIRHCVGTYAYSMVPSFDFCFPRKMYRVYCNCLASKSQLNVNTIVPHTSNTQYKIALVLYIIILINNFITLKTVYSMISARDR